MNKNEVSGFINNHLVFEYLIKNKTLITIHLEDGTILSGIMLGRDELFLHIMENISLNLIQIAKIVRLRAEVNLEKLGDLSVKTGSVKPNIIPDFAESNGGAASSPNIEDAPGKKHFKERLDQLVRNW